MGGSTADAAGSNAGGPLFDVAVALGKRDEVTCCISCTSMRAEVTHCATAKSHTWEQCLPLNDATAALVE